MKIERPNVCDFVLTLSVDEIKTLDDYVEGKRSIEELILFAVGILLNDVKNADDTKEQT